MSTETGILAFAHIGDLHLVRPSDRNYVDLLAIVAQLEMELSKDLDFVVLPGDNADHGLPQQYQMAATALKMLSVPVHAITGDHDMEQGGLSAFHAVLAPDPLPKALTVRNHRCLFLDISGPGEGGPDFRIGDEQMAWVERELQRAQEAGRTSVVFMHSYPADLKGRTEPETLNALFDRHGVALVDMGHTHYNELANDGRTIFAATRSTGQIDEGPVGYSVATLDDGVVSWRFKLLDDPFPFVMITSPADHRLMRDPAQRLDGDRTCVVRALVFGRETIATVTCQFEGRDPVPMQRGADGRTWGAEARVPAERLAALTVRAVTAEGRPGQHTIRPATSRFDAGPRPRDGSDAASIGAWPENGILGTQLGPNRNGRHW